MKAAGEFDGCRQRTPWQLQQLMVVAFGFAIAMRCCLAAQQDERKGFLLTAAMEWRRAAELLAPFSSMSNRCWCEWERIMRLPRRLARPIGACNAVEYGSPAPHPKAAAEVAVLDAALAAA